MPKSPELESEALHDAIVLGRPKAFRRLYGHYEPRVRYAVAAAAFRRRHTRDVDELVQEVWCRVLENDRRLLRRFDSTRGRFGPFIAVVAYQQALIAVQRHRRQLPKSEGDVADGAFEDPGSSDFVTDMIQSDLYEKVLSRAMEQLGPDDQLLLSEVHLHERSFREVAAELGVSENAAYKRNERLKRKLEGIASALLGTSEARSHSPSAGAVLGLVFASLALWPMLREEPARATVEVGL
ncbi:MAG: sigma-70 family RNA polymerase sigma factor [Myxococcota bacterium]